jgi:hypothetical protein
LPATAATASPTLAAAAAAAGDNEAASKPSAAGEEEPGGSCCCCCCTLLRLLACCCCCFCACNAAAKPLPTDELRSGLCRDLLLLLPAPLPSPPAAAMKFVLCSDELLNGCSCPTALRACGLRGSGGRLLGPTGVAAAAAGPCSSPLLALLKATPAGPKPAAAACRLEPEPLPDRRALRVCCCCC